jgi:hypothetical protein
MAGAIGASYGISGLGSIGEYLAQGTGEEAGSGGENFSGAFATVPIGPIQPVSFQTAVLPAVHPGLPSITASLTQAQIGQALNAGLIYVQTPRGYVLSKQAAPAAAPPPPSRPPTTPPGLLGTPGHPISPFTGPTVEVVQLPGGGFAKVNPATGCPPGYHKDASGNCILTQLLPLPSLPKPTAATGAVVGGILGGLLGQPVAGAQAGAKLGEVAELARQEAAKYLPTPRPLPAMIPAAQFGRPQQPQPVQPQPQPQFVQPQPVQPQPQPQFVQPQPVQPQPQPQFVQPQPVQPQPQPQFVQPQPVQPQPQPTGEVPCLECGQPPAALENCPPEARAAYQTLVDCGAVQLLTQEIMKKIRVVQRPGHPPVLVQAEPVCLCCDSETDMQVYQETNGQQGKCVLVRSPDVQDFRVK